MNRARPFSPRVFPTGRRLTIEVIVSAGAGAGHRADVQQRITNAFRAKGAEAGYLHVSHTSRSVTRCNISGHSALLVQSGTAASDRGRCEESSFNVIRIDGAGIAVERFEWQPGRGLFEQVASERYRHTPDGWV